MSADLGTLETFDNVLQRTDEWYALRLGLLTASAAGKLVTARRLAAIEYACPACDAEPSEPCWSKSRAGQVNKTVHSERTAQATAGQESSPLILELADGDEAHAVATIAAAERIAGFPDPTGTTIDMQRGVDDEPFAVDAYAMHVAEVTDCGFMIRTFADGTRLGYSPDGLVGDDGLIEIKSRRGKKHVETVVAGEVPAENMAQIQAGLLVSGRAWCDYVSYSAGLHLWTKRVYPDAAWFAAITDAVYAFELGVRHTVDAYTAAVAGLPLTDRPVLEMVI